MGTPPPASQPSGPKKVAGVSVMVWVAIAAVAVIAIVGAVVIGGGSDDKETATPDSTSLVTDTTSGTTTGGTTPDDTIAPDETVPADTEPDDSVTETTFGFEEPLEGEIAGAPAGATGTRDNPVPAGEVANIGGGWRLQVLSVTPDATAAVMEHNQFNEPPPAGSAYTLVRVALGYYGLDDPQSTFNPTISAVGSANIELPMECGPAPDELELFTELFAGGVIEGNLCYLTTPADIAGLQLYAIGDFFEGSEVFMAAASPSGAAPLTSLRGPQPGAAATANRLAPTPIGTTADVGEGWSLTVNAPARDITDEVLAENQFNEPPPPGFRFIGVDVTYAFDGTGSDSVFTVDTGAVADTNVRLSFECGSIPTPLDEFTDVFAGGELSGLLCFVVPEGATALTLYSETGFEGPFVMFATG